MRSEAAGRSSSWCTSAVGHKLSLDSLTVVLGWIVPSDTNNDGFGKNCWLHIWKIKRVTWRGNPYSLATIWSAVVPRTNSLSFCLWWPTSGDSTDTHLTCSTHVSVSVDALEAEKLFPKFGGLRQIQKYGIGAIALENRKPHTLLAFLARYVDSYGRDFGYRVSTSNQRVISDFCNGWIFARCNGTEFGWFGYGILIRALRKDRTLNNKGQRK